MQCYEVGIECSTPREASVIHTSTLAEEEEAGWVRAGGQDRRSQCCGRRDVEVLQLLSSTVITCTTQPAETPTQPREVLSPLPLLRKDCQLITVLEEESFLRVKPLVGSCAQMAGPIPMHIGAGLMAEWESGGKTWSWEEGGGEMGEDLILISSLRIRKNYNLRANTNLPTATIVLQQWSRWAWAGVRGERVWASSESIPTG